MTPLSTPAGTRTDPTPDGFVAPAYRDRSLADVLPAVASALGRVDVLGPAPSGLVLPGAASYVVVLVDGLGFELLLAHGDHAPYLHTLLAGSTPATAGVPSTTATSLTSLGTSLLPGTHGMVGYTSRIPGTLELLNALAWSKGVDPGAWQPYPTAFARLAEAGVRTTSVTKREFAESGLTQVSTRGADFVGVDRLGERLVAVQQASAGSPSLTYVYDGDLDWTGHRYGVDSAQWRAQLAATDVALEQLREALPAETGLVVVADHGMVDVPSDARVDVDEHPPLRDGVLLVGGEARFRHVYCRPGAVADTVATWRSVLGARAEVLEGEEAIARGWFGEVTASVRPRLGDVVAAGRGNHAVLVSSSFPLEQRLIGMHGSLTPVEMLIPVLVA